MSIIGETSRNRTSRFISFPNGFVWGAATASFQIEGATALDGRTPSIWDTFCAVPGAIAGGDTGEPAADHYRRMASDVALMSDLGLRAYRFSIAWPRIRAAGGGHNPAGLDFYERLVDTLLEHDIAPWPTLYHWDLPQELEEQGGWTSREVAHRFAAYTDVVLRRLGDRVSHWTTLNEPWCSAFLGYASGKHAPGRTEPDAAVAAAHHLMLAHGLAVETIREHAPAAEVGITLNLFPVHAADPHEPGDVAAANTIDGLQNRLFLNPLLQGHYPDDVLAHLARFGLGERIEPDDLSTISAPLDMLGVNYYREHSVSARRSPYESRNLEWVGAEDVGFRTQGYPVTESGWEVIPRGLAQLLIGLHERYPGVPLYITENGAAYDDVFTDGEISDGERITFVDEHLRAAHTAISHGVDLRGYFYWSLLDNFEWAEGYAKRFGLVHVDFATQRRTPKSSASWFSAVIAANGLPETGES